MKFNIVNAKGLFSSPELHDLLSEHAFGLMKEKFAEWSTRADVDKKTVAKVKEALELIELLPTAERFFYYRKNDLPGLNFTPPQKYSYGHGYGSGNALARCYVDVGSFNTKSEGASRSGDFANGDALLKTLDVCVKLSAFQSVLEDFAKDLEISLETSKLKRCKTLQKRFNSGEYTIKDFDPSIELGQVNACVIFVPGHNGSGGYLDGRAGYSPLAGARLFESAGSARTTIRSRHLQNAVVLHIKAQLVGIDPDQGPVSGNNEELLSAIARIERLNLEKALEDASVEQLKERLARYEQQQGMSSEPPAAKRRM